MLFGRFVPIIAPMALAGSLAAKKPTPFTAGTLRTDTFTFGFVLLGTILLVGALLFLPAAVLGPVAEHLGPVAVWRPIAVRQFESEQLQRTSRSDRSRGLQPRRSQD